MAKGPLIRASAGTHRMLGEFFLASLPAVLIGVWNLGAELDLKLAGETGTAAAGWPAQFGIGASAYLPLLATALLTSLAWSLAFSRLRRQPPDPGWWLGAWLFAALLPPAVPLGAAALGISFGYVFGSLAFGGIGRYPIAPPLLGVLFLDIAYPGLFAAGGWLPGSEAASSWSALAGAEAGSDDASRWLELAAGREIGAVGAGSALACLAGGAALVLRGWASARTLIAGLVGLALASSLLSGRGESAVEAMSWYWHLAAGNFAFMLAFIATDPSTQALTRGGRWLHGLFAGMLLVALRVLNPEHPEASYFAFTLACLFTASFDHAALAVRLRWLRRSAGA